MRWLVRSIQICLILVFVLDAVIPLASIIALAFRDSYVSDFSPTVLTLIQTQLALTGAIARFFGAFRYMGLVLVLDVLWIFYLRALAIVASYQMPMHMTRNY